MAEFFAPAFDHVEADWMEKLIHQSGQEGDAKMADRILRITTAIKAIRVVRSQIEAFIADGIKAEGEIKRSAQIAKLTPHKRDAIGA